MMKRKQHFFGVFLLAISVTTAAGFVLGQHYGPGRKKVADLDKQIASLEARLAARLTDYQMQEIQLRNLQAELKLRQKAESAVKENYKFENIESRMASIKLHFNDLQREVAAGEFPGLALTPAYQQLRQIFDNPEFDRLVRAEHTRDQ